MRTETWVPTHEHGAQSVSEARAAVHGRPETEWHRVFTRDVLFDAKPRAGRPGAAHQNATEENYAGAQRRARHAPVLPCSLMEFSYVYSDPKLERIFSNFFSNFSIIIF